MKKYNLKNIMKRAWEIYRTNSDTNMKAVFAICLQIAWAEAKASTQKDWRKERNAKLVRISGKAVQYKKVNIVITDDDETRNRVAFELARRSVMTVKEALALAKELGF